MQISHRRERRVSIRGKSISVRLVGDRQRNRHTSCMSVGRPPLPHEVTRLSQCRHATLMEIGVGHRNAAAVRRLRSTGGGASRQLASCEASRGAHCQGALGATPPETGDSENRGARTRRARCHMPSQRTVSRVQQGIREPPRGCADVTKGRNQV